MNSSVSRSKQQQKDCTAFTVKFNEFTLVEYFTETLNFYCLNERYCLNGQLGKIYCQLQKE